MLKLLFFVLSAELDSMYPGVVFYGPPISQHLMSSEATIDRLEDLGVSVFVPQNALSSKEESLDIQIRPCFSGTFQLPDDYEPASPAYLIHHNKMHFQKDITIKMLHYANLHSEEDCDNMIVFSASSTPEYMGSRPVYTFKKSHEANSVFKPGDVVGEISLQHFCFEIIGRKRQRAEERSNDSTKKPRGYHYCYSSYLLCLTVVLWI